MVTATEALLRFIGTCRSLNPFLPLSLPPLFPIFFELFWGVPGCNTHVHPDACFVAGNTCPCPLPFFPPLPLSFFLSCFSFSLSLALFLFLCLPFLSCLGVPGCSRHSWEPFSSSLGVSLDACVLAGITVVSFLFFFFPLFSPYPSLPRARRAYIHKGQLQQVSQ